MCNSRNYASKFYVSCLYYQEIEVDDRTNLAVVSVRSACPTVLGAITGQCDTELDSLDWVIARIRANHTASLGAQTGGVLVNGLQVP